MITIYDLLDVSEDASKEEIEKAYRRLVLSYRQDSKFSAEENEMLMNKLKMAYDILTNDEKRKKYDSDLAKKRAENLIKNVSVQKEEPKEIYTEKTEEYDEELTKEEQERIKKAAQEEFQRKLKKVQKAEEEYKNAYNEAYNEYMRKNGYNASSSILDKLKRILKTIVCVIVLILIIFIVLKLPPVQKALNDLYEGNVVIKTFVDIIKTIFNI